MFLSILEGFKKKDYGLEMRSYQGVGTGQCHNVLVAQTHLLDEDTSKVIHTYTSPEPQISSRLVHGTAINDDKHSRRSASMPKIESGADRLS